MATTTQVVSSAAPGGVICTSSVAQIAQVIPTPLVAIQRQVRRLQREAQSVARTVKQFKEIAIVTGRAYGWQSAQFVAVDETLRFWQNRYRALVAQQADARARYVSLLLSTEDVSGVRPFFMAHTAPYMTHI